MTEFSAPPGLPRWPGDPRLLVIGGGIAGASVAYFAARAGWDVKVLDSGVGRASDVPGAVLNPVRGQSGLIAGRDLEGMRLSWSLIRELSGQGHRIPHGQTGVLKPIPNDQIRARFERQLPPGLSHQWLSAPGSGASLSAATPSSTTLAPGWPHRLLLPEGGWLSGAALTSALLAASGARLREARAESWDEASVTLQGGEVLSAGAVVWCGGSIGASWGGGAGWAGMDRDHQMHRGGSVLLLDRPATPLAVSAGVYLAPAVRPDGRAGGVLGATFEAPTPAYNAAGPPLKSLHWLLERAAALTADLSPTVTGLWSGSRLAGETCGRQPAGWWALAGLGSRGFLLGPLLARELVAALTVERARC